MTMRSIPEDVKFTEIAKKKLLDEVEEEFHKIGELLYQAGFIQDGFTPDQYTLAVEKVLAANKRIVYENYRLRNEIIDKLLASKENIGSPDQQAKKSGDHNRSS